MSYTTLISCQELAAHLDDSSWAIVDCRFDLGNTSWGEQQYRQSHIPGAVYAHLDHDLSGERIPGVTGRHPLPAVDDMTHRLSRWGIDGNTQVIAYDQNGGMMAARLWWLLRWLGHDNVAVLDGGWQEWTEAGNPMDSEVPKSQPKEFVAQARPERVASAEEVEAFRNEPGSRLLDARGADRFCGENETMDPVAGHIPGAISAPFANNLGANGRFLDQGTLQEIYRGLLGETQAEDAIVYCGSGVTASHDILAMVHAGLGEPRLYAGSWSHWITDPARPIQTFSSDGN